MYLFFYFILGCDAVGRGCGYVPMPCVQFKVVEIISCPVMPGKQRSVDRYANQISREVFVSSADVVAVCSTSSKVR